MSALKHYAHLLVSLAITVLIGGFLTAALVRLSPGFGVDEHELDPTRDVAALRRARPRGPNRAISSPTRYAIRPPCCGEIWGSLETGIARWRIASRTLARDRPTDGSRHPGRMGAGPGLRLAGGDLSQPDLECAGRRPERLAFVRAIGRAGAADLCLCRTGARRHGAGRIPQDLSVSAECAVARRCCSRM